jgi:hypothetical protein
MKKPLVVFLLLSGVSLSFVYYYWRQATQIPAWYTAQAKSTPSTLEFSNSSELRATRTRLKEKIEASIAKSQAVAPETPLPSSQTNSSSQTITNSNAPETSQKNVEVELSDREVNELVMTTVAEHTGHSQILANTPSLHTTIKDGVLESGTVVNLANLPREEMSESERAALEKVVKTFPFLESKEIYVGISGKPQIENGQLKLDNNTKLKLGNVSLSLSELSQRLGISQENIEQKLNLSLPVESLKINDVQFDENKVLLRGSVEN